MSINTRTSNKRVVQVDLPGVILNPYTGLWTSAIVKNGRINMLGQFKSKEEAYAARYHADKEVIGDFQKV